MAAQQKPIVLVFGATGKQGGSVIKTLQKDNQFHIRGITRKTDHRKVSQLENLGVEVKKADIVTGEGLDEAFNGVWAAFLLTHSFEKGIEGEEFENAKKLVDKAHNHGVKILIWSTSPHAHEISKGKFNVPQYTEKAKVEDYIRNLQQEKEAFESVVFISLTFYYQNFHRRGFSPKKESDGSFSFKFPDVRNLVACDVNEVGQIVFHILKEPHSFNNKQISLIGDQGNIDHYVQTFERVTGQKSKTLKINPDELAQHPELHHGKQLAEMFKFMNEAHSLQPPGSIPASEIIKVKSFADWLQETGWKGELCP